MRLTRLVGFLGIVLFCAGQSLFAQSKQERKEQKERVVREIVDSGRIKIDVDRAVPMAGRSVNLTSPYSLEIHGDSILSYLPYFGRAYSAPYGGGEGLTFKEVATEKEQTSKKERPFRNQVPCKDQRGCIHVSGGSLSEWLGDNQCDTRE